MMNYSREYAPLLWQLLRLTGMDRLLIGVEREIKFINLYRARDRARALDDGDFDRVLDFLGKAFDLALDFNGPPAAPRKPPNARAKPVAAKSSSGKSPARKGQGRGKPRPFHSVDAISPGARPPGNPSDTR